jgi:transcriptional regulator with XRE-family HTH domain
MADPDVDGLNGPEPTSPARVGEIIKRLRRQHGLSLREVAARSELSTSFLSSVERGESDIAVGRLARVAACFDHDVGSLLGYTSRRARPRLVTPDERIEVQRGSGVKYDAYRLPAFDMELFVMRFDPGAGFENEISHEGLDAALVLEGELVLTINGDDYRLETGTCAIWSAAYLHALRNDAENPAVAIGLGEAVY